jgi:dienelactone hydrolase
MDKNINRRNFLTLISAAGIGVMVPNRSCGFIIGNSQKLPPLLVDAEGTRITALDGWLKHREVIRNRWLNYLGAIPKNPNPPKIKILKEDRPEGLIRQYIEYEGEPGIKVQAYLIKPENINIPRPGIVAMHSTSDREMRYIAGVEKGNIVDFGYQFAKQGYVVICPQCFLMHNSENLDGELVTKRFQERHPGSKGMAKMLFDAQRAVDVLESVGEVDNNRIGAMGHSLGAKEALYLGAFDDRVKAVVSNEGGIGINFSNWDAIWYLGKEIHEFGQKHHEVLSLAAPKPFLLIGGDSADGEMSRPYIAAVRPVYDLYGKEAGPIELYNHGTGHSVHPTAEKRTYEWMDKYL